MQVYWRSFCRLLTTLCVFSSLHAGETLHYRVDAPVLHTHHSTVTMRQEWQDLILMMQSDQVLDIEMTVVDMDEDAECPKRLAVILRRLKLNLRSNDCEETFDSKMQPRTALMAQVVQLIDIPIYLSLNSDGSLTDSKKELLFLNEHYPLAAQVLSSDFFDELAQRLFPLTKEALVEGNAYEKQASPPSRSFFASPYTYELTSIDAGYVAAKFVGEVNPNDKVLPLHLHPEPSSEILTVKGNCSGKSVWDASNALRISSHSRSSYKAYLKSHKGPCTMNVVVDYEINSLDI
jgi:hypothetical protein